MAQKDYQSATAQIAAVNKADMLECSARHGPAAKACEIQADGKRAAAEDQAKLARDRAGAEPLASDDERKKAAEQAARLAKITYGMEKARIASEDNQAHAECKKIKGEERNTCNSEVLLRTSKASREAKESYDYLVKKAKGIDVR